MSIPLEEVPLDDAAEDFSAVPLDSAISSNAGKSDDDDAWFSEARVIANMTGPLFIDFLSQVGLSYGQGSQI